MQPTSATNLSAGAVARFARDLAGLIDVAQARVLVAVSGGPDSLALLLLARDVLGDRCFAATVDHRLRSESAAEAAWVARVCAARGIEHAILTDDLPTRVGHTANVSARARALRYRLLATQAERLGGALIATAHHADDQLETMIMRLNRGAGVAGLTGVRARTGAIIRPLLGWRHAELVALVDAQGITAIDDPSNVSERFDRARLRKALADVDWLDANRIGASARALGDAEDALSWMVHRLEAQCVRKEDDRATFTPEDFPFELRRRLVELCVLHVDAQAEVRGPALVRTLRALEAGERSMLGDVMCDALIDSKTGPQWLFSKAPPRRSF